MCYTNYYIIEIITQHTICDIILYLFTICSCYYKQLAVIDAKFLHNNKTKQSHTVTIKYETSAAG